MLVVGARRQEIIGQTTIDARLEVDDAKLARLPRGENRISQRGSTPLYANCEVAHRPPQEDDERRDDVLTFG